MEFRNLKKQYQVLRSEIDAAISEVLTEANFISGKQVVQLEEELAEYVGVKHCITCANGTDALQLALMAWNIRKGDAVFVPDFTFFSSGEVVSALGATPVFVDIDPDTFNISTVSLEKAIQLIMKEGKLRPKVIIGVDLFGQPADFKAIKEIADKYDLLTLEDGAQGFGGRIGNKMACSFGDISCTSFFPAKPLGCYGDGGAIFTNDDNWNVLLRSYRIHGKGRDKYDNLRIGMNSRLDTIQAAILLVKLKAFKEFELEAVNRAAQIYTNELKEVVKVPVIKEGYYSSWAQYSILLPDRILRDKLQGNLKEKGIPSMIYYFKPMHKQMAFHEESAKVDYGITERVCDTILSLPMHPYLEREEIEIIASNIRDVLKLKKGE